MHLSRYVLCSFKAAGFFQSHYISALFPSLSFLCPLAGFGVFMRGLDILDRFNSYKFCENRLLSRRKIEPMEKLMCDLGV